METEIITLTGRSSGNTKNKGINSRHKIITLCNSDISTFAYKSDVYFNSGSDI